MSVLQQDVSMQVFEELESKVRSYSRSFPTVFETSKGYKITDVTGREYIDFFAGAGTLNYGHNNDLMKKKVIEYVQNDGITHSLDMGTTAREAFLTTFNDIILKPRNLDYKIMFPGPTGTNTVESALKLARKVTGRELVLGFTNGFHGMTYGALAVTGNASKRGGAGTSLPNATPMPFDNYMDGLDSAKYIDKLLNDGSSGIDLPAAFILETVQGEGGINAASYEWVQKIANIAKKHGIMLIIDDVQAGNGRTGTFFSFEPMGIEPDIVCMSKSIGGFGLPLAITLIKPEHDVWAPGEHNGTFRGNNLAFITATEALEQYWKDDKFQDDIQEKGEYISDKLADLIVKYPEIKGELRGRGMMKGIACGVDDIAGDICAAAFERGLIMETSGPADEVAKLLPPLIIDKAGLKAGIDIMDAAIAQVIKDKKLS